MERRRLPFRMRYRPVVLTERTDPSSFVLLADHLARSRVRVLSLPAMPSRDPAVQHFIDALGETGFVVESTSD